MYRGFIHFLYIATLVADSQCWKKVVKTCLFLEFYKNYFVFRLKLRNRQRNIKTVFERAPISASDPKKDKFIGFLSPTF